jgi:hypothetical protein
MMQKEFLLSPMYDMNLGQLPVPHVEYLLKQMHKLIAHGFRNNPYKLLENGLGFRNFSISISR